jgi:hypothetical protein
MPKQAVVPLISVYTGSTLDSDPYLITDRAYRPPPPVIKRGRLSAKKQYDHVAHNNVDSIVSSSHDDKQ